MLSAQLAYIFGVFACMYVQYVEYFTLFYIKKYVIALYRNIYFRLM